MQHLTADGPRARVALAVYEYHVQNRLNMNRIPYFGGREASRIQHVVRFCTSGPDRTAPDSRRAEGARCPGGIRAPRAAGAAIVRQRRVRPVPGNYIYIDMYIYIYVYIYLFIYLYVCVCGWVYTHVYIYIHIYIYIYIYMYIYVYTYVYVYVCMYVSIHVCTRTYVRMRVYI